MVSNEMRLFRQKKLGDWVEVIEPCHRRTREALNYFFSHACIKNRHDVDRLWRAGF